MSLEVSELLCGRSLHQQWESIINHCIYIFMFAWIGYIYVLIHMGCFGGGSVFYSDFYVIEI